MCSHQKWTLGSICTSFPLLSECFPSILTQNHQNSCLNSLNLEGFKPPSRPHFIGVLEGFGGVLEGFDQNLGKWLKNHFSQTWLSLFLSMNYHLKHLQSCPEPWFYGHILEIRPSNKEKWPTSRFSHLKPYQLHLPYLDRISVYRGPPHLFLFGHRLWYLLIISIPLFLCFVCFEKSTFSNTHFALRGVFELEKLFKSLLKRKVCGVRPRRRRSSLVRKGKGTAFELEGAMDWIVLDGFLLFESPPPYFKASCTPVFEENKRALCKAGSRLSTHVWFLAPASQQGLVLIVCAWSTFSHEPKGWQVRGNLMINLCSPARRSRDGGSGAEKRRPSKTQKIKGKAPPFISPLGRRTSSDEGTLSPLPELVTTWCRGPPFSSQSR
jgi:hypothetical protein